MRGYRNFLAVTAVAMGVALTGVASAQQPPQGAPYSDPGGQAQPGDGMQGYGAQGYGSQRYADPGYADQGYGGQRFGNQGYRGMNRPPEMAALRRQLRQDIQMGRPRAAARDARQLARMRLAMRQQFRGGQGGQAGSPDMNQMRPDMNSDNGGGAY